MTEVHHMQMFSTPTDDSVFDQCDRLMIALLAREDGNVYDSAVSADLDRGLVTVEVNATGADISEAEGAAVRLISQALADIGQDRIELTHEISRNTERVPVPA